jgi:HPt (histidine-containing phosphotransfer) domain-containing protein
MVAYAKVIERSPPRRNADAGAAIDTVHLARMTLGELSLQREVLALFDRQADVLLPRIRRGTPAVASAMAHTLNGSAASIGAFRVARAAEAVEQAQAFDGRDGAAADAIDTLAAVLDEARAEIARLLQAS